MKLLITAAWQGAKKQFNNLETHGYDIVFMQNENGELPCRYEEVEGVICNNLFLYHSIEKFISLRFIQLTSAGFDRVPMEYIQTHNIKIFNARGVYSIPMAEFTVCGVLQLYKQSCGFYENQKNKVWQKNRDLLELFEKTVCIVGCGNVGTECAKRFKAFGCHVIGVDLFPNQNEYYEIVKGLDEFDGVLSVADVVILTLPLTAETKNLINQNRLDKMKNGSVLVNIARGGIIDEKALRNALRTRLLGAVLDVFEKEPLDYGNEIWDEENVILTPHNSFVGEGNENRLWKVIKENLMGIKK